MILFSIFVKRKENFAADDEKETQKLIFFVLQQDYLEDRKLNLRRKFNFENQPQMKSNLVKLNKSF